MLLASAYVAKKATMINKPEAMSGYQMKNQSNQLHRQWALLQKIPVKPAYKTVKQLMDALSDDGFTVSKRTVERDLNDLKYSPFAVTSDEKGVGNNPNRWFFERDAKLHLLPAMTMQMAFTLLFSAKVLKDMLPSAVLQPLETMLKKAENTLKTSKASFRHWDKYVKHVPRSLPLIPARVEQSVLDDCLNAMLNSHQLTVTYQPRYDAQSEYQVNPLGLVYRDSVIYLVCTLWEYTDIRQLALHRIIQVTLLPDRKCLRPTGFDLDDYISKEGGFLYNQSPGKLFKVELRFDTNTVQHLNETPLSPDQVIINKGDYSLLRATVMDSSQLRWWLLGFGQYVEVIKPKKLREEFKQVANDMMKNYR